MQSFIGGYSMSASGTHESADHGAWVFIGLCAIALGIALALAVYARSIDASPLMLQSGLG
jgi:hypothetical protein